MPVVKNKYLGGVGTFDILIVKYIKVATIDGGHSVLLLGTFNIFMVKYVKVPSTEYSNGDYSVLSRGTFQGLGTDFLGTFQFFIYENVKVPSTALGGLGRYSVLL